MKRENKKTTKRDRKQMKSSSAANSHRLRRTSQHSHPAVHCHPRISNMKKIIDRRRMQYNGIDMLETRLLLHDGNTHQLADRR